MKRSQHIEQVMRYQDHDLTPGEIDEINEALATDPAAKQLHETYKQLEQAISLQPSYHPTRDIAADAVEQVDSWAPPVSKRTMITTVCSDGMLVIG